MFVALAAGLALASLARAAEATDYHVATTGDDQSGDGSAAKPWRTIAHAVDSGIPAAGGDSVIVADGVYDGTNTLSRGFPAKVTIRAEHAYKAKLTNTSGPEPIRVYIQGSAHISIEGFLLSELDASYTCPNGRESYFVVHLQDVSDITLQNNIIFGNNAPGHCNELVKINRSANTYPKNIHIVGNLFYDQVNADGADMIDSVRPGEIEIADNIFYGEPTHTGSQSFITLKRQAAPPGVASSPRYRIHRNVFLNWGGKSDQAFLQLGEDGVDFYEISSALIENNLMIGNSPAPMAAPFQFKGAATIGVRANTVVGDLPSGAYGFRIGTEGQNPPVAGFDIRNNVFSDPTGTMGVQLVNRYGQVNGIGLHHNLYFNKGQPLPSQGFVTPADDLSAVVGDPALPADQTGIVPPVWDEAKGSFPSGNTTIREEFLRLVDSYGKPGQGSAAIDAADPAHMPADDIRGVARDAKPDVGAYEYGVQTPAPDAGVGGAGTGGSGTGGSGTGGSGTGGGGAATGGASGSAASSGDSGGCGCRIGAGGGRGGIVGLLALLLVAVVSLRRS